MKGFFNIKFSSTSVHTFYKKCIYDVINILLGKNYRGSCPELFFFSKGCPIVVQSFGQWFIITLIRYFSGVGLDDACTTNLDYNYYILRDLDSKILGLRIWISIFIYGYGLENTWATNLDYYDY